jgi:Ca-activated chloride channel family protein
VVAACLCVAAAAAGGYAYFRGRQASASEPTIEYILDASPRMQSQSSSGESRIVVARGVLADIVRTAEPRLTAGLRVFGTGAISQACNDTDLVVPLAASNQQAIEGGLGDVAASPDSESALAQAMVAAIRDLTSTEGPHSIVAVTGGVDSCNPEAAELVRREAEQAGIDLRMYVVGFEVAPEEAAAVKAFVEQIPGATYTEAAQVEDLERVLVEIQTEVNRRAVESLEPGPVASSSGDACDHRYFPLRSGATWNYATSEGSSTWTVTSAGGGAATMDFGVPGGTFTVHWSCGDGGVSSYDFGSFGSSDLAGFGTIEVVSTSGTWIPSAEMLEGGSSWSHEFTTTVSGGAEGITVDITATTSEDWTASGVESVSVPAGTFEAIRVDGSATTSISGGFFDVPATSVTHTFWYAPGVGIVKWVTSMEGYTGTGDLTSYTIP